MICPYCQTYNRDTAKYCDSCGAELPTVAPEAREMFGQDEFLIDGTSAITLDLEGLERMVDSSNSYAIPTMPLDGQASAQTPESVPTIPLQANQTQPIGAYAQSQNPPSPVNPYPSNQTTPFAAVGAQDAKGNAYIADPQSKQYVSKKQKKPFNKKKLIIVLLIVVLLALLGAGAVYASYNLQIWGGKTVPDVIRQTEDAAKERLNEDGFDVSVHYVVADDVEGIVLSSDPAAGARVEEGSTISLDVSIPRVVPDVVGELSEEALEELADSGYLDVDITTQKSNEPEGTVLSITPAAGERATSDVPITLVVAEPYRVPGVAGMSAEEATAALEAAGYVVQTQTTNTEDVAEGLSVGTEPAADSVLASGSTVKLLIAHNRSNDLIALVKQFFVEGQNYKIANKDYQLGEVQSVTYQGNDVCAYTITARLFETHSWFGSEPETRYGNYETLEGTITFNASNEMISSSPSVTKE